MRATLYVKGVRVKQVEDRSRMGHVVQYKDMARPHEYPDYRVYKEITYESVLPEDQKALVQMVEALAVKYGFELKVVDVTEKGLLQKLEDKLHGINTFPAFVTDRGSKIEGDITEERIKALLAQ